MSIDARLLPGSAPATRAIARAMTHPWVLAALIGASMGAAVVASNGVRWPGHRSFFYALGLTLGLTVWRGSPPAFASGLLAGTIHAAYRGAFLHKDGPWEPAALVLAPAVLGLLWGLAAPVARGESGRPRWWFPLAAALFCLTSPAISQLADALSRPDKFGAVLTRFGKPWYTHPSMALCGAIVAQAILTGVWFQRQKGDKLRQ
ncbi:MAG: hypothetical protein ACT4QC_18070 [Planctomycetaceae bacterium]